MREDYLILRFDVPGFGLTGPMPDAHDFSADYMCNIVEQLTKRLGITRFSIAGNSMGGYIAWNYAWRFPEKVEHLVVVDSMSYPQRLPAEIRAMSRPVGGAVARRVTTLVIWGEKDTITPFELVFVPGMLEGADIDDCERCRREF